jgi:hypothetical protein
MEGTGMVDLSTWKIPKNVEKPVTVKVLSVRLVSGEMPNVDGEELYNEVLDWAFHKGKDFGEHAGFITEQFTQDDSLLECDTEFALDVTIF